MSAQRSPSVAIDCIEALLRGELLDTSIDARAAVAYLVQSLEFIKQCQGKLAGLEIK